jgi:LPS O-antigen subunit length determinant protein (WzzB/FepE family)
MKLAIMVTFSWVKHSALTIIGLAILACMALLEYLYVTQPVYEANPALADHGFTAP